MKDINYELLARQLVSQSPQEILSWALQEFDSIAVSFSGAEDVALVHMVSQIQPGVQVFTLDTGRLHPETYQFIETVRETYPIDLKVLYPDAVELQQLIREKGLFSFYTDGHQECCNIRKVQPLTKKLASLDAWITGQRQDQSPQTRAAVEVVHHDAMFSSETRSLTKINPLACWSSKDVWTFIRENEVPYNPLHNKGFVSIGCEPCTRAVLPNQHEREGRWWWEESTAKECGLHSGHLKRAS